MLFVFFFFKFKQVIWKCVGMLFMMHSCYGTSFSRTAILCWHYRIVINIIILLLAMQMQKVPKISITFEWKLPYKGALFLEICFQVAGLTVVTKLSYGLRSKWRWQLLERRPWDWNLTKIRPGCWLRTIYLQILSFLIHLSLGVYLSAKW